METGSPSITKILTMVLFALSVIGLTMFLWLSFGGTIPLTPRGYEFRVSFTNASQLADQADVSVEIAQMTVAMLVSQPDSGVTADRFGPLDAEGVEGLKEHQKITLKVDRTAPGFADHEH